MKSIGNFVLDHGVITNMIEGKEKEKLILEAIAEMKMRDKPTKAMMLLAHFLRGVSDANSSMPIKNIKKIIECVEIIPDIKKTDFRDDDALVDEIVDFMIAIDKINKLKKAGKFDEFVKKHGIKK